MWGKTLKPLRVDVHAKRRIASGQDQAVKRKSHKKEDQVKKVTGPRGATRVNRQLHRKRDNSPKKNPSVRARAWWRIGRMEASLGGLEEDPLTRETSVTPAKKTSRTGTNSSHTSSAETIHKSL